MLRRKTGSAVYQEYIHCLHFRRPSGNVLSHTKLTTSRTRWPWQHNFAIRHQRNVAKDRDVISGRSADSCKDWEKWGKFLEDFLKGIFVCYRFFELKRYFIPKVLRSGNWFYTSVLKKQEITQSRTRLGKNEDKNKNGRSWFSCSF